MRGKWRPDIAIDSDLAALPLDGQVPRVEPEGRQARPWSEGWQ